MAIMPRLEIKQSQSLLMTQQLRQAINLLQLSNIELNEFIEQELSRNPLLEKEDEHLNNQDDNFSPTLDSSYDNNDQEEEFKTDIDYNSTFDDYGSDSEGYENLSNYDWTEYNKSKDHHTDEDFDYFEKKASKEKSLYQFINEQIGIKFKSATDKMIATRLSDELDAAGYFRGTINEISLKLKCQPERVQKVLNCLKEFEPSGIFAESLSECLKIQLQDQNRYSSAIAKIIDNLELLAQGKLKELQKICHVDIDDLSKMINDIKSLNPKPACSWNFDTNAYIIPDVFVHRTKNGSYRVELNQMSLPRILINHQYYSEISKHDKQAKRFLKENLSSANFLIKAMHQRATSILRVSEEIVRTQQDFFEHGIESLRPLSLKDIAYNLEMHESTISRVTSNKYIHTPYGMFELKFFFSAAAGSYIGKEDVSTLTIKHKIKQIITEENKDNILSDDKIVEILGQEGIKIARRTVAKYRESMNIPTSAQRKRNANKHI